MNSNDYIILNELLTSQRREIDPSSTEADFFEYFSIEQILKDYDLSDLEIESGQTGGPHDGGVDGFYMFLDDQLIQEDFDTSETRRNPDLHLHVIQSKGTRGFEESPIERFMTFSSNLLDLSVEASTLEDIYNERLVENIALFKTVYQQLVLTHPTLSIYFQYASKGNSPSVGVTRKVAHLEQTVRRYFPNASFRFDFVGATELMELARKSPQTSLLLNVAEGPISSDNGGSVGLVRLQDLYTFITDANGQIQRRVFEANVRDYQGRTSVNDEIQQSLIAANPEDFWWLNNGITVLCTQMTQSGKIITAENPQIVNGLQTATEIHKYVKEHGAADDRRTILVRVIQSTEDEVRDRIIKATNSQTTVQHASLRATDKIQRDIEDYFKLRDLYYDRRKNTYKGQGKPRSRVISITSLAQSVMAIVLQRPDSARARPSSLLKSDQAYQEIFAENHPINLYYVCIEAIRAIENRLKDSSLSLPRKDRSNLRFHVGMYAIALLIQKAKPNPQDVASLALNGLTDAIIDASLSAVKSPFGALGGDDKTAKGPRLREHLCLDLSNKFPQRPVQGTSP